MDIREAKYMLELEKTKNLTKAASNLFLTQPGLTKVLKKLEAEFDDPLFIKEGRELLPTPVGEIILKKSAQIAALFDEMYDEIEALQSAADNVLNFGAPAMCAYIYAPVLSTFQLEHPDVKLHPRELGGHEIARLLQTGELNAAIAVSLNPIENMNENLIFSSEAAVGIDASHPWANKDYISIEDFQNQHYVTVDEGFCFNTELNRCFHEHGVTAWPSLLGQEPLWLMEYAKITNVPCILPVSSLEYYRWPTMLIKPLKPTFMFELSLIYPKANQTPGTKQFIRFIMDYFNSEKFNPVVSRQQQFVDISNMIKI